MEIKQEVMIHNRFDIHVDNIETGEHIEHVTHNIILNQMYNQLCNGSGYFGSIHFGTGSGVPSPERTSLFSHLGTKGATTEEMTKNLPVSSWKRKIVINPEEYVGANITEVGIAFAASASSLVTHAMLKDAEGNPISINKTNTDVVTIYATVFVTLNTSIYPEVFYDNMNDDNILLNYLIGGTAFPAAYFFLLPYKGYGNETGMSASAVWTADVANKKRKTNTVRFGTTLGNGDVLGLRLRGFFRTAFPNSIFSGQSYTGVSIGIGDGIKEDFGVPSKNVLDETLIVKRNGVIVTDYTISKNKQTIPTFTPLFEGKRFTYTSGSMSNLSFGENDIAIHYYYNNVAFEISVLHLEPGDDPAMVTSSIALINFEGVSNSVRDLVISTDGSLIAILLYSAPYIQFVERQSDGLWKSSNIPINFDFSDTNISKLFMDSAKNLYIIRPTNQKRVSKYEWTGNEYSHDSTFMIPNTPSTNSSQFIYTRDRTRVVLGSSGITSDAHIYDVINGEFVYVGTIPRSPGGTPAASTITDDGKFICVYQGSDPCYIYEEVDGVYIPRGSMTTYRAHGGIITDDGEFGIIGTSDGYSSAARIKIYALGPGTTTTQVLEDTATQLSYFLKLGPHLVGFMNLYGYVSPFILDLHDDGSESTIVFNTPPTNGSVITADYKVKGVHKTDQYVIDVSASIQFGEGV